MLAKGRLPNICLVTGERGVPFRSVTLHERMSGWFVLALAVPLFVPFFLLPFRAKLPLSRRASWGMLATRILMFPAAIVVLWVICLGVPILTQNSVLSLLALPVGLVIIYRGMNQVQVAFLPHYEDIGDHVSRLHVPSPEAAGTIRIAVAERVLPDEITAELAALGDRPLSHHAKAPGPPKESQWDNY